MTGKNKPRYVSLFLSCRFGLNVHVVIRCCTAAVLTVLLVQYKKEINVSFYTGNNGKL